MVDQRKGDSSSVSSKEKNLLLDLDIGKDFLTSWKSISIAEGDEMDFELTPGSGNNKSFKFNKADIDFNLDGGFGKMSSFNMDMSDLDISPPLKKDENLKEKPKESLSIGKDKGKADRFAFAFDFDELDNFNFESNLTKDGSNAEKDKNKEEISLSGSGCLLEKGFMQTKHIESMIVSEDDPPKSSLNGTVINFDVDSRFGGDIDLAPIKENYLSKFAMDEDVTSEHSDAIHEYESNKETNHFDATIASVELPKVGSSEKLVAAELVELKASTGNGDAKGVPSDYLFRDEPHGNHSSEQHDEANSLSTNKTSSKEKNDFHNMPVDSLSSHYKHAISGNSHLLQSVEIAEDNKGEETEVAVVDHVLNNKEKVEVDRVKSVVESSCTTSAVPGILGDKTCTRGNNESALKILKVPLDSRTADLSDKQTKKGTEPSAPCLKSYLQSEKPGCPAPDIPKRALFPSSSSENIGFTQPSLVERKRESVVSTEADTKIVPLPSQYSRPSKTQLKELPQIQKPESYMSVKVPRLMHSAKPDNSSSAHVKETKTTKSDMGQREKSMKELDALRNPSQSFSLEVNKVAAQKGGNPTSLGAIQISNKNIPAEGHNKLFSIERGRNTNAPDPPGVKLQCLSFESTKSPIRKDVNSIGGIGQNKVLPKKATFDVAHLSNSQKQIPTALSTKRKTMEGFSENITALHQSKRLIQSTTAVRNILDTSEKLPDRKVPSHSNMENKNIDSSNVDGQLSTLHVPHGAKVEEVNMSFLIESSNNIKPAEAYSKELDDLCNMLRKKHDEAKEILVRSIVNNNKLLMLNHPLLDEKIRATQNIFARLTLNCSH